MTDIVTYCDVNTCTECPRYGDDCDGDKRVEHTDYISRADAIEAVAKIKRYDIRNNIKTYTPPLVGIASVFNALKALPSADAKPTVIRSKTLMPTKDFKEWAKRIREENPNAIIIPCDAEVVSAEAEWIPVSKALPSEGQVVLAIGDKGTWDVGQFKGTAGWTDDERMWWWKNKSIKRVEYWMPKDAIPLPYREDGEA